MSLLPSARVGLGLSGGCLRSQQPSTLLRNARFALPRHSPLGPKPAPFARSFHSPVTGPGATGANALRAATMSAKAGSASSGNPVGVFIAGFGIAALTDFYTREPVSCGECSTE